MKQYVPLAVAIILLALIYFNQPNYTQADALYTCWNVGELACRIDTEREQRHCFGDETAVYRCMAEIRLEYQLNHNEQLNFITQ